jgi:hypothetical protein
MSYGLLKGFEPFSPLAVVRGAYREANHPSESVVQDTVPISVTINTLRHCPALFGQLPFSGFLFVQWICYPRGIATLIVDPFSELLRTSKYPWWASTTFLAIGSPNPVPPCLVVKKEQESPLSFPQVYHIRDQLLQ